MPVSYVNYDLQAGFIHHWLVSGPQAIPISALEKFKGESCREQIADHYYEPGSGITKTPVEPGPLAESAFTIGDYEGSWSTYRCRADHYIDHTAAYPIPHYLRSWAYTQLVSYKTQEVILLLATAGPASVWLNGQLLHRRVDFSSWEIPRIAIKTSLQNGTNKLLIRFEAISGQDNPHLMGLCVCHPGSGEADGITKPTTGIQVRLPTAIQALRRRNLFEQLLRVPYLDRNVYGVEDQIRLHWPEDLPEVGDVTVRLQTPTGRIYAEANITPTPGERLFLGHASQVPEGALRVLLMPQLREYYDDNVRVAYQLDLWNLWSSSPAAETSASYPERKQEALRNAARRGGGLFSEVARMALDAWKTVDYEEVLAAINAINQRSADSAQLIVGLLGMHYRFGGHPEFSQSFQQPLEDCLLSFVYLRDRNHYRVDLAAEANPLLFHTCELLAGQLYPDQAFADGQSGSWHRQNGEQLALEWMQARAVSGFSPADPHSEFADIVLALSHLIDLAESEPVWELASVLLDKVFFTLALNSHRGIYSSPHWHSGSYPVTNALADPIAPLTRLMWGVGVLNQHIAGQVGLACLEKYELPTILADIAKDQPEAILSRERHLPASGRDRPPVDLVTYRTPDTQLASLQNYAPGQPGGRLHVWQASLGPAAMVFANHPVTARAEGESGPGFWLGNAFLPRVAQWKDVLVSIHNAPQDDWIGFTHAYFPTFAFDEYTLQCGWAFARQGDGYLALTASPEFEFIRSGQSAKRELRVPNGRSVWLCQMGRAALDGDFTAFQERVLSLPVNFTHLAVRLNTLRGDNLSFGWDTPLLVDGEEQPLSSANHYESPYCTSALPCAQMEIYYADYLLRLDFTPPGSP